MAGSCCYFEASGGREAAFLLSLALVCSRNMIVEHFLVLLFHIKTISSRLSPASGGGGGGTHAIQSLATVGVKSISILKCEN